MLNDFFPILTDITRFLTTPFRYCLIYCCSAILDNTYYHKMNWIYAFLIALGFLPLAIVLYKMNRQKKMKRNGIRSTATVLQLGGNSLRGLNRVLIQYPVTGTGEIIRREIIVAGTPYQPGDSLPMYYDRNNPHKMILDGGKNFIVMIVFTSIIAVFLLFATYMIRKAVAEGSM